MRADRGSVSKIKININNNQIKSKLSDQYSLLLQQAEGHIQEVQGLRPVTAGRWTKVDKTNNSLVTKWQKKDSEGRTHLVTIDNKYHINTYVLKGTEQDKQNKLVGTNSECVVKLLGDNSYDYVKTEDFIERAALLFDAARKIIQDDKADKALEEDLKKTQLITWLQGEEQNLVTKIKTDCALEPDFVRKEGASYFDPILKRAEGLLQQSCVDITEAMREHLPQYKNAKEENKNSMLTRIKGGVRNIYNTLSPDVINILSPEEKINKKIVADIVQTEKEIITERGRPLIVKVGKVGKQGEQDIKDESQEMISVQIPLGEETIPSSERKGNYPTKLSNHVRDLSGYVTKNSQTKNREVNFDVMIDGHSSYPPIGEPDEIKRRHKAGIAAKEKVSTMAQEMLRVDPTVFDEITEQTPLEISFSAMMMLTPFINKKIENIVRPKESELNQVADTRYALEILRNKKQPFTIPVKVDGVSKNIFVKVDISYMNLPVNVGRKTNIFLRSKLSKNINARGFHEFSQRMNEEFKNNLNLEKISALLQEEDRNRVLDTLSKFDTLQKNFQTEAVNISHEREALEKKYLELENILAEYNSSSGSKKENKKEYKKIKNEIISKQNEIYKKYIQIQERNQKIFNAKKMEMAECKGEISALISRINTQAESNGGQLNNEQMQLRDNCINQLRFLKCQELLYSGKYLDSANAYHFHVNYLLADQSTGRSIEAFCKSAEDRTGWLRVSLLSHAAFVKAYGRDPDLLDPKDKEKYNRFFSAQAHELSASIENTQYNSKARGLQIGAAYTNPYIGAKMGNQMAKLAKGIVQFKKLKKIKPVNKCLLNLESRKDPKNDATYSAPDSAGSNARVPTHPTHLPAASKVYNPNIPNIFNSSYGEIKPDNLLSPFSINVINDQIGKRINTANQMGVTHTYKVTEGKRDEHNKLTELKIIEVAHNKEIEKFIVRTDRMETFQRDQDTFELMLNCFKESHPHKIPYIHTEKQNEDTWSKAVKSVYPEKNIQIHIFSNNIKMDEEHSRPRPQA